MMYQTTDKKQTELDRYKDYYKQIKPFNFCLVGFPTRDNERTKEPIKPTQCAPNQI